MRETLRGALFFSGLALSAVPAVAQQGCKVPLTGRDVASTVSFNLDPSLPSSVRNVVQPAIDAWTKTCTDVPSLVINGQKGESWFVREVGADEMGAYPTACAWVSSSLRELRINRDGNPKVCGVSTNPVVDSVTHEIGHILGLDHPTSPACKGNIMYSDISVRRKVTTAACDAVREARGIDPPPPPGGGGPPGPGRPGRGDDPMSLCTENPDECEGVELVCTKVTVTSPFGTTTTQWECEYLY